MKTTLILTPDDGDTLHWQGADAAGSGGLAELASVTRERQTELVLAVPQQRVLLREVAFEPHERRLLRQTVPFTLEEQLLDDVATQHVALGPVAGTQVPVAVVARDWLGSWLQRAADAGLDIRQAVPEVLLLPWQEDTWTLQAKGARWLVRVDRWRGFALEADSARLALQILLDDAEAPPQRLLILAPDAAEPGAAERWQAQLPELLRGIVDLQPPPAAAAAPAAPTLDFLQGVFARRLPWQRWWSQWRMPAVAALVAVAVQFGVSGLQHHRLAQENLALRRQIEQIYRSAVPAGVIADPERQLQRKVTALEGGQASPVLPLLQRVGSAVHSIDGIVIQTLGYSERQGELRLNIVAASFKDVEALRAAIARAGLAAQLVGSSADGDRTRAQLRVAAGPGGQGA